jgi:cytochrome c peroxidase
MHDGRYKTLEEVVEFYNSGVHLTPSVDPIMTKPGKENGLELTQQEIQWLVAFLKTLTDTSFLNNPELSNPF